VGKDAIIVIDNGSSFIKAGIAGEENPRVSIPTVVGWSKKEKKEIFVGEHVLNHLEDLKICRPLDPRKKPNWEYQIHVRLV